MILGSAAAIFRSAIGRLTIWYLAIIMTISVTFSFAVYKASTKELDASLQRQARVYQGLPRFRAQPIPTSFPILDQQLADGKQRIEINLFLLNLAILILAGAASYWLAKLTLSPIEDALDSQSRFTADASHELRTPLTAMKTEIEVALRNSKFSHAEAKALLQSNLEEIAKLEALSNGLLKLAQGNGQPLVVGAISLTDALNEAICRLEVSAKNRQIVINLFKDQIEVDADRESLIELFVILLDNAIKYSPPQTMIQIKHQLHNHSVDISIADQGQGIKASDLPHIFDRFYRADRSRSKEQIEGYGLGLSIAQKIAAAHNTKISVISSLGKGSVFTVTLPLAKTDS